MEEDLEISTQEILDTIEDLLNNIPLEEELPTHREDVSPRPAEWWDDSFSVTHPGIKRLAASMIYRALQDAIGYNAYDKESAMYWIKNWDTGSLTFFECCSYLNLEPDNLYKGILRRIKKGKDPSYRRYANS